MLFQNTSAKMLKLTLGWVLISSLLATNASAFEHTNESLRETIRELNTEYINVYPDANEKAAIRDYTSEGYYDINNHLRDHDPSANHAYKKQYDNSVCAIDQAFAAHPIHKGKKLILYRGHSYLPEGADQVGYKFTDHGYTSTSILKDIAMNFTTGERNITPVLDIIQVSTDTVPGLWLNIFSSWDIKEYEVLLHRGTQFEVIDVKKERSLLNPTLTVRTLRAIGIQRDSEFEKSLGCH